MATQVQPPAYNSVDEKYLYDPSRYERSQSPLPPATPRRGSNESSPAVSEYDEKVKNELVPTASSPTLKSYGVMHTKSHINMRVQDSSGRTLYYVDNSFFTPGKPDVTLCAGSEKTDPVIGVVRWSNLYSKHLKVGLGSGKAEDEKNMVWEEVRTEHMRHPEHKWSIDLMNPNTGATERKTFAWKRIHGDEAAAEGDGVNTMSFKNFKCVDLATGQTVAVFASNRYKSWNKLGKITFKGENYGQTWEVMAMLTVFGLVEMSRRRGRHRRSGAAHGE
ncbi:hypothetical protein H2198_006998 [Neophaeococcomyces mojaviensis]|uniref:Uncharacterized protein n=1 Tax=Neophaeococcomyces mojaviensis TaxID=3383035 RepID=A0ACC3A1D4_9EURO|nr:hypothetical protein H2198_006998 [Knufia sp. JES_112]